MKVNEVMCEKCLMWRTRREEKKELKCKKIKKAKETKQVVDNARMERKKEALCVASCVACCPATHRQLFSQKGTFTPQWLVARGTPLENEPIETTETSQAEVARRVA